MQIQITQEDIDECRRHVDGGGPDDGTPRHFPCLTERKMAAALLMDPRRILVRSNGMIADVGIGCYNPIGQIDTAGIDYVTKYDQHQFDQMTPGEFEFTPTEGLVRIA